MQCFANVGTDVIRKESKSAPGRFFYETRVCESQRTTPGSSRGAEESVWYTVRLMKDVDPGLSKGDFVKVTGKLKTDFYLNREGKPTGTLLILAFEIAKIARPAAVPATQD